MVVILLVCYLCVLYINWIQHDRKPRKHIQHQIQTLLQAGDSQTENMLLVHLYQISPGNFHTVYQIKAKLKRNFTNELWMDTFVVGRQWTHNGYIISCLPVTTNWYMFDMWSNLTSTLRMQGKIQLKEDNSSQ